MAGGLALGFATTSYYSADVLFGGGAWWGGASRFWLIAGVLLGPLLGVVATVLVARTFRSTRPSDKVLVL